MPSNDFELTDQIPPSDSLEEDALEVPSHAAATNALSVYLHYKQKASQGFGPQDSWRPLK